MSTKIKTTSYLKDKKTKIGNHLKETWKNKCRVAAISLVFLSLIFFLTMLIGSAVGTVYLNKYTFDPPISQILHRNSIEFTLLGYCIDDSCTGNVNPDFDKAPSSGEIQSGVVNKRSINIPGGVGNAVNNAGSTVSNAANNAGSTASNAANNAGSTASNAANDAGTAVNNVANSPAVNNAVNDAKNAATDAGNEIGNAAQIAAKAAVNALLSAFDNFVPKQPTNGESGWIARPVITAAIFNTTVLILLLITNEKNRKYCYPLAFILLLISFVLNLASLVITYSLFSLVFDVIGAFPGIGSNETGPAIYLSGWSSTFLFIALILIIIDMCRTTIPPKGKEGKDEKTTDVSEV